MKKLDLFFVWKGGLRLWGLAGGILLSVTLSGAAAPDSAGPGGGAAWSGAGNYFGTWFDRVTQIQSEQPHWITPLVTVTPRLEEEYRYDQYWETVSGGHELDNYGGGKGLELIPCENVELIFGEPAWETENTLPRKSGWADETFLAKYRIASGNEENGNYIVTAFMGLSIPTGSAAFTTHHTMFTPTIAAGKGWGDFDIQSTLGVAVPDNGAPAKGPGTPLLFNTALQYRVAKYFWPPVEANYTYYPDGEHEGKSQLFLTPGVIVGRLPIWKRLGITLGVGYQVAVTDRPLVDNNFIVSGRLPF